LQKFTRREKEPLHKINNAITAEQVRVVGEDIEQGVYPLAKAIEMAFKAGLDLVEISPNAEPPVCKIVDYKKFLYEQKKKQKEIKANTVKQVIKEIRFGPNTDDHDVAFKLNHARHFLQEGNKVRCYVFFRGRTIMYKERGEELLMKFANTLQDEGIAKMEMTPKIEGKKMAILLAPKGKKG
jgi:translation initiation factor IF-3